MNNRDDSQRQAEVEPTDEEWLEIRRARVEAKRRRKLIIAGSIAIIVVAIVALILVWRLRNSSEETKEPEPIVSVKVAKAERQTISANITALGTIFPRDHADVAAKISAQIKQMALLKNRPVQAGQIIAVLESRDLVAQRSEAVAALREAQANERSVVTGTIPQTNAQDDKALRDARANVANARATYQRRQRLFAEGGISQKDLEASQLALTQAEDELRLAEQTINLRAKSLNPNDRALAAARVAQAQQHLATVDAQLGYAAIRAPITGIVTEQFQYQGEFAASGAKLVTISDINQVIVKAPFADTIAGALKVGDTATVVPTDSSGEQRTGQISLISRSSDPQNRTVEVWVTLGNQDGQWRANGAAQVTISSQTKTNAIVIPASAVTLEASNASEGTVMVVDAASVAHETNVTVGIRTSDQIEITSGLNGGETVVTEGNFGLADNTRVEIETAAEKPGEGEEKKEP
ncbi:MAG: efflux RND transporter periplasmic adaptor subunit [Pyrinomonadaceae bacterium]